jgi:hypothetical protein
VKEKSEENSSIVKLRSVISYDTETHKENIHEVVALLIRNTINSDLIPGWDISGPVTATNSNRFAIWQTVVAVK